MKENTLFKTKRTRTKTLKSVPTTIRKKKEGYIPKYTLSEKQEVAEIAFLTSYPPRECGIATYSSDLVKALQNKFGNSFKLKIYPLEAENDLHDYSEGIDFTLNTDSELDFQKIAHSIDSNVNVGMVMVQHEFGLFRNNEKAFFEFLEFVNKPIIVTFHTVLPNPDDELKDKVNKIATFSDSLIVMTHNSEDILVRDYGVSPDLITVIPHGTHSICHSDKIALKAKYDLKNKNVLSTFGLLGPGKSIETTLHALPEIVEEFPETVFLILGKTHPSLLKEKGEDYREFIEYKVDQLGLQRNVRFVNQFLPLENLLEYLQLTDIYLFTSKDPNQAVSGTFSYALSCGCPVVSTPIPHALEVLQNNAGCIFDFEDSEQLAQAVIDLLQDDQARFNMRLNGLHHAAESVWENAAIAHGKVFEKMGRGQLKLNYQKPNISLAHIKEMTTDVGIIQFSKINQPDFDSGYTLDDNARALIALCRHFEITGKESDLKLIRLYFNFIKNCFRPDSKFLNYVDEYRQFTPQNDEVNLEDANGRAIWALGYLISIAHKLPKKAEGMLFSADQIFEESLSAAKEFHSPRAIAFVIKGLYYFNKNRTNGEILPLAEIFANRLVQMYRHEASKDWQWFEEYLTYGNSVMPHALLMAFSITNVEDYKEVAKESFDFLLTKIFSNDKIQVVSNNEWLKRGQELPTEFQGGEQPIDIAYTILALRNFHEDFPDDNYDEKMEDAFSWFMGNNALNQTIYNPCTGGCYDGLEKHNINLNQGAESTISYLLARMVFEEDLK